MAKDPVIYILASKSRAIYTGVTSRLQARVIEHRTGKGHTRKYRINRLIYVESHPRMTDAIRREKQVKGWDRAKRVAVIESVNPDWDDYAADW